jgi:hypothetical protein
VLAKLRGAAAAAGMTAGSPASAGLAAAKGNTPWLLLASCAVIAIAGSLVQPLPAASDPQPYRAAPLAVDPAPTQPDEATQVDDAPIPVEMLPVASPSTVAPPSTVGPASTAAPASAAAPPGRSAALQSGDPDDALAREARLLGDAERAYRSGDHAGALVLLDRHAREFPHGQLADERAVRHIVVLCSLGRTEQAVAEGRRFVQGRAPGPLTRSVESTCAGQR